MGSVAKCAQCALVFRQYCNAYELLLKTKCNIQIAHSAMTLYVYNLQILMDKK